MAAPSEKKELRLLVCGSRDWEDIYLVNKEINRVIVESGARHDNVLIIQGGAPGADTIARILCEEDLGYACATFYAPWIWAKKMFDTPRSAGPRRNGWMIRWGNPNYVLAFHPYLPNSRGTKNLCTQARAV